MQQNGLLFGGEKQVFGNSVEFLVLCSASEFSNTQFIICVDNLSSEHFLQMLAVAVEPGEE